MSQHDFNISNQTASVTRADINNALGALATLSSGAIAPATTYANMLWYETDTNTLWMRNEADSTWLRFAYLDQGGQLSVFENTKVVNTSGTQVGLIGDQTTSTWQAGTSTTESLISPAKLAASSRGLTLIGEVSTSSGTSVSIGGVNLTSFEYLSVEFDNVSSSTSATLHFGTVGGSDSVSFIGSQPQWGTLQTSLSVGGILSDGLRVSSQRQSTFRKNTTTLTFSLSTGNFSGGSIKVFGVK